MSDTFLQIFLLVNVFLMGILASLAVRHAYAHFRPHTHDAEKTHPLAPPKGGHLPPELREKLLQEAQTHFKSVVENSSTELQHDLKATAEELNKKFEKLGSDIVNGEAERYNIMLESLRKQTEEVVEGDKNQINGKQSELKTKLAEQMAAEQERLIKQIDTKLADAVVSFLIETMQHNIDLGAQTSYLTTMLEEHKADFKREVGNDEAPAA